MSHYFREKTVVLADHASHKAVQTRYVVIVSRQSLYGFITVSGGVEQRRLLAPQGWLPDGLGQQFRDHHAALRVPEAIFPEPFTQAHGQGDHLPGVAGRLGELRRGSIRVGRGIVEGAGVHEDEDVIGGDLVPVPAGPAIDAEVAGIMTQTHANGMAVAVIDHGRVRYVQSYGIRNAGKYPLTTDTIMYGASLTKTVFAYTVMQLVDQGKLNLDTAIKDDLNQPLPSYGPDLSFPTNTDPTRI